MGHPLQRRENLLYWRFGKFVVSAPLRAGKGEQRGRGGRRRENPSLGPEAEMR